MTKAVLQTKINPAYDDLPEERYHFPRAYLNQIKVAVGDQVVFYEPRRSTADVTSRGGRQAYFAIGRISGIRTDERLEQHYYADIVDYLEFVRAVPFKEGEFYYESSMRGIDGRTNPGAAQRAVRNMPDAEFATIVAAGFSDYAGVASADAEKDSASGFDEAPEEFDREIREAIISRPVRDRVFTAQVQHAYRQRCAFTGLRIINGGGRAEAQAAHIRPVAEKGPDSIRNGLALSSTMHWMFDRGLLSIDDDMRILKAKGLVPPELDRMINPDGYLQRPVAFIQQPHPLYLRWHREFRFKG